MKYDVFISYRRVGGKDKARSLKSELERRGYRVFLDFDDLKDRFTYLGPQKKRLAAIFVTRTGKEKEPLLGMITPWDMIRKED